MPKLVFTSDTLPANLPVRIRATMWAEAMKASGSSFEMGIVASKTFRGAVAVLPLGKIQIGSAETIADGEVNVIRSEERIAADNDNRIMIVINRGETTMQVRQFGRKVDLGSAEMAVLALDSPCECWTPRSGTSNVVLIPREILERPGQMLERCAALPLEAERGAQRLLAEHVRDLLANDEPLSEAIENKAGDYIASLAKAILRAPGAALEKPSSGEDTSRLMETRNLIAKRYHEASLNPSVAGKALGISGRSIQLLLRQHGTTFSDELTRVRLEAAYAILKGSRKNTKISEIAMRCGFTELSTFYRAFRLRYGETPKSLRGH